MKAGEAGGSMLMSALNACRARLKAFIRGRTSVRDDADDILQEVTYQLMKVEQPVENVAAWLFRAARNEMTDRARKSARCRSPAILRAKTTRFPGRRAGRNPVRRTAHAGRGVPQNAAVGRAGQALSELPPPQRRCLKRPSSRLQH
jgi:DNA-directed RNA polymerase specialized sigma24 family protein